MALRLALAWLAVLALSVQPALAQGFWQSLFGGAPSRPSPPSGHSRPHALPVPGGSPFSGLFSPYQHQPNPDLYDRGGTYRTLCVRMCDGYYFPISYTTTRSGFARDADKCAMGCGEEARLFYYPNPGGEIDDMVDLSGRSYASYPNAFKYRKTLVKGCQCRPQPWSEAELRRHRAYAEGPSTPGDGAQAALQSREPMRVSRYEPPADPAAPQPIDRKELEIQEAAAPSAVAVPDKPVARPRPPARQKQASGWEWLFGDPTPPPRARR